MSLNNIAPQDLPIKQLTKELQLVRQRHSTKSTRLLTSRSLKICKVHKRNNVAVIDHKCHLALQVTVF